MASAYFCCGLMFLIPWLAYLALAARRMGYSSLVWLIAGFAGDGFLAPMLLWGLPSRTLERRRAEERRLIEQLLAKQKPVMNSRNRPSPTRAVGDRTTLDHN